MRRQKKDLVCCQVLFLVLSIERHHKFLIIKSLRLVCDVDDVDDGPDIACTTGDEFQYAKTDVAKEETIETGNAKKTDE